MSECPWRIDKANGEYPSLSSHLFIFVPDLRYFRARKNVNYGTYHNHAFQLLNFALYYTTKQRALHSSEC